MDVEFHQEWEMLPPAYENWAQSAAKYFAENYGLAGSFALDAARLYVTLWGLGLGPRITSGFRDPRKQAAMRAAWDAGNRVGLRARPADPSSSRHCGTSFLGRPAATAIDMPCSDDRRAAAVATTLGIGSGNNFTDPDPGHFYSLKG